MASTVEVVVVAVPVAGPVVVVEPVVGVVTVESGVGEGEGIRN